MLSKKFDGDHYLLCLICSTFLKYKCVNCKVSLLQKSVRFAITKKWFKSPRKFIDRTKAVTQHFLKKSFKKLRV